MTPIVALGRLAAGESWALSLLAVMVLMTPVKVLAESVTYGATELARRLNGRAWSIIAVSALCYRPVHSLWLIGHPAPAAAARLAEVAAVSMAIGGFITLLAARGFARGLSLRRVRRGVMVNIMLALTMTGAAWLTR